MARARSAAAVERRRRVDAFDERQAAIFANSAQNLSEKERKIKLVLYFFLKRTNCILIQVHRVSSCRTLSGMSKVDGSRGASK